MKVLPAVLFGLSLATSVNAQVKTKIQELCITPQSTIRNFFNTMSGPSGQSRDSALYRSFFSPESYSWYITNYSGDSILLKTSLTKVKGATNHGLSIFQTWEKNGFREDVFSIKVDQYRNIAQAWVVAKVKPKETEETTYLVQDSFQLFFDGVRWVIMSICWQREVDGHPIPNQ
jgi:hypothetical protein